MKVWSSVYGMLRALVITSSQTQVLSLWSVDNEVTTQLIQKYYQYLHDKAGRHEALRKAQLDLLNNPTYNHPYYWAAFIPSGNWQPLPSPN